MNKPKSFFVVSNWNNDVSWVKEFTDEYVIFDKSDTLSADEYNLIKLPNVGYNIYDILKYITDNYDNLPDLVAFLEGNPFDHCKRETFDKIIYNETLTPIEDYSHYAEYFAHKKDVDGGYMEINNSWYLDCKPPYTHKYFSSFDMFMLNCFTDYERVQWVRFAPGAQYIVPKENILHYSKAFYQKIMSFVDYDRLPVEAHLIERALYLIFMSKYTARI
jgi:hypothetical protein